MATIESKLSEIMGARRLKIADLQRGTGITYAAAHSLYHGKNKMVRLDVLAKICEWLDVQVCDLFVFVPSEQIDHEP